MGDSIVHHVVILEHSLALPPGIVHRDRTFAVNKVVVMEVSHAGDQDHVDMSLVLASNPNDGWSK
jgi:hypothetical protein